VQAALLVPVAALLACGGAEAAAAPTGSAASCAGATTSMAQLGPKKAARSVVCLTNVERRAVGLPPLRADSRLAASARGYAADMARRNFFSHVSPGGSTFASRARAHGFDWSAVGENLAAGQTTPRTLVRAWVRSPGHCTNIISRRYTAIGVGAVRGGPAPYDGPTWVQDLGRPRGTNEPAGPAIRCPRRPVS
jgi:uncharacterized protein YkwD